MIDYRAGHWGFHVSLGWHGSLAPRALTMAVPNALITFMIASVMKDPGSHELVISADRKFDDDTSKAAQWVIGAFTSVMIFILYNRSNTAYDRWWEGGTLLQKTRGEWFNAYSSIMAFTSTKPEMQEQVEGYVHLLARLMSLLMCCGLQQVSPKRDRPFEIIELSGIEPASMEFLNSAPDKVEIILQWIQRSMVLHAQTGVLPVAPPILSRAFQEVSRGIVNLQNARKIADFPYPYPLAQVSMILQLLHWAMIPIGASLAAPRAWAVGFSFFSIFVLWCIHFNALDLEFPFGNRVNDLPMAEMQQDWNRSIYTLLDRRATRPPHFAYDAQVHDDIILQMSEVSELYVPVETRLMSSTLSCGRVSQHNRGSNRVSINVGTRVSSKTTVEAAEKLDPHSDKKEKGSDKLDIGDKMHLIQPEKVDPIKEPIKGEKMKVEPIKEENIKEEKIEENTAQCPTAAAKLGGLTCRPSIKDGLDIPPSTASNGNPKSPTVELTPRSSIQAPAGVLVSAGSTDSTVASGPPADHSIAPSGGAPAKPPPNLESRRLEPLTLRLDSELDPVLRV
eukprot:TRINITY_DN6561_c0_g2_i1.p1 TRINITY_DN6561_c0_g2~~TRINITY_DN6561_c0_g2_i1.p1  ORF type:complete len:563 (-),score=90.38 TRINITY_DN6561_c0_g2_i1:33-1721(-)